MHVCELHLTALMRAEGGLLQCHEIKAAASWRGGRSFFLQGAARLTGAATATSKRPRA
jgi:hypothetical protein